MESPKGCLHPKLPGGYHRITRMEAFWEIQNTLYKKCTLQIHQESVPPTTPRKIFGAFHVLANEMNE
jgi:hypothetical protein